MNPSAPPTVAACDRNGKERDGGMIKEENVGFGCVVAHPTTNLYSVIYDRSITSHVQPVLLGAVCLTD